MSKQSSFSTIEGAPTELTSLEGRVGLRDVPRHGGEQRDAMLRGGDGVCGGRVDDEAAVLGGGGERREEGDGEGGRGEHEHLLGGHWNCRQRLRASS